MGSENWHYKVRIVLGLEHEGYTDPTFFFTPDEKEKMQQFIDVCLENGQEVSIITEDQG